MIFLGATISHHFLYIMLNPLWSVRDGLTAYSVYPVKNYLTFTDVTDVLDVLDLAYLEVKNN